MNDELNEIDRQIVEMWLVGELNTQKHLDLERQRAILWRQSRGFLPSDEAMDAPGERNGKQIGDGVKI